LTANIDGKAAVAIFVDEQLNHLNASALIKELVAPLIKGGGGGQKTLATAGGQDPKNLQQVIDLVRDKL
jgi:alanyl-tRNA synthetase